MYRETGQWIEEIISSHPMIFQFLLNQRAKFEGWLKIELLAKIKLAGAYEIDLETSLPNETGKCDLSFAFEGKKYYLELKTPNTNWRMPGVQNLHRPITKNISSIVQDGKKLLQANVRGIIGFTLFPVPVKDRRWEEYYERIISDLHVSDRKNDYIRRVTVQLESGNQADIVIGSIPIEK